MKTIISVLALSALAAGASAQQIADRTTLMGLLTSSTTDDFETYRIASGGADNLDISAMDSTSIANGQGPGLVNAGAKYADPSGVQLQWNGDTYFGMDTQTILSNGTSGDISISYAGFVQAVGIDTKGFSGFPWNGFMDVYNGGLIDTISLSIASGGSETAFAGYLNAGGITGVVIRSANYSWSPVIDNSTYGVVPEPLSIVALASGLVAMVARRRRK